MVRSVAVAACAVVLLGAGCGKDKAPAYDRSTPEGTVRAFFGALNKHRIPEDLGHFFNSDREVQTWQMRCKYRGCSAGTITRLEVAQAFQYRAVLEVDYNVRGNGGSQVMAGEGSPITLIREGKVWKITEFGRRLDPNAAEDGGE